MSRIVLFGATGYTGRLAAHALVKRGAKPLLAGRNRAALEQLAKELGGLETAVADVSKPESLRALLGKGDVLVSTVGPYMKYGHVAVQAAIDSGAHYLDCTGEGPFIRDIFLRHSAAASRAGSVLLTAFGYDFVPGNLAAALALREAGADATSVDVGYFMYNVHASGGTLASMARVFLESGFTLRGRRIVEARGGARVRAFHPRGQKRTALSAPASEHFALPRIHEGIQDVEVFIGLPMNAARPMAGLLSLWERVRHNDTVRGVMSRSLERLLPGSTGGPTAEQRAGTRSEVVAEVRGRRDEILATVTIVGGDPYDCAGDMLAWGAIKALNGAAKGSGAMGPAEAFGLEALLEGCAEAGFTRLGAA